MKKTAIAIATASLLLLAGPTLADRDDRHGHRGKDASSGSALREAHSREQRRTRNERREHDGKHRPAHRRDDRGDRGRHHGRGDHRGERDRHHQRDWDQRGDRDRQQKRQRDYDRGYKHGYKHGYRHAPDWGRPHYKPHWPRYRPGYRHHRPRWRPAHYGYGYQWRHLPSSFVRISVGGLGFFYSDGIFYRPHSHGYVVAQPPLGAIVYSLPATAVTMVFGGLNYYVAYDTCYQWDDAARGYRVVGNPGFF